MIDDLTQISAALVAMIHKIVREEKPEATQFEIEGLAYRILHSAIENYKHNEQQTEISPSEGSEGTPKEPEQVQGNGDARGLEESSQGVLSEQGSLTKSGRQKRRSKKS